VSFRTLFAAVCGVAAVLTAVPAAAQTSTRQPDTTSTQRPVVDNGGDGETATETNRTSRTRSGPRRRAEPTPAQNLAAAQALMTTAGLSCQATEAARLGVTTDEAKSDTYEVICATGPGYLLIASNPPKTFNCIELASQAMTTRERDPAADVGQQCTLPANQNPTPVVAAYAAEAGITCTVDQGAAIGKNSTTNELIYEVGCADADGFWLEKEATGWSLQPCYDLALQTNGRCRFTTTAENMIGWKGVLEGTTAAACDVQQARRVGRDAQGLNVYEVKCGSGDGYFARVDAATRKAQRAQTCVEAANVAGGCTLTTVAPAAAPAPAAPAASQQ
jgi:hypothetical protein